MELFFDASFAKSLKKINDKRLKRNLLELIEQFEKAETLSSIPTLKKMVGFQHYYRVRLGAYRVGLELLEGNKILLIIVAHRKEIYKYFP